jgi:hypothetical protein
LVSFLHKIMRFHVVNYLCVRIVEIPKRTQKMKHQILSKQALLKNRSRRVYSLLHLFLSAFIVTAFTINSDAQAVSGIVTDYNGYWKTSAANKSNTKPANSHNLLAFTYGGVQYSTGVNDLSLRNHGETFTSGSFWSLPLSSISGTVNGNTKIGVGEMYDNVHNGAGNPAPLNNIGFYLTDGVQGLNIGTGIANLPSGTMSFNVSSINPQNIGDGIPDILVTQIADPSGSTDKYSFVDASGNIIGHTKEITFTNITPVATWTADFYEASQNPMTLTGGYTNTDRDLRLWAADLSDLGITAANYQSVKKFVINLSGNSDLAFVAYNNMTFTFQTILPVKLSDFSAKAAGNSSLLKWTTETESNSSHFIIERSVDNSSFTEIGTINAKNNTVTATNYSFTDSKPASGINYYRLKMVDMDGSFEISKVVEVRFNSSSASSSLFPNPCSNSLTIHHPAAKDATITIYNTGGVTLSTATIANNSLQTKLNTQNLQAGMYYIVWQSGKERISMPVVKK